MSTASLSLNELRPVRRTVRRLRWMVRFYVMVEGLAALLLLLGAAFWIALVVDWLFEPAPVVRGAIWTAVLGGAAWVAYRWLLSRVWAPVSDCDLALLMERKYPSLAGSLVTTVEASQRPQKPDNPALLRHTSSAAQERVANLSVLPIFRWQPLFGKVALAGLLWLMVFGFAFSGSEAFAFWMQRMKLGEELWPRRVQLSIAGLNEAGDTKTLRVARDANFDLHVHASLLDGHKAPERVEIRYRLPDGSRGVDDMVQIGDALVGRDDSQQFRYTFKNVSAALRFDVLGGDDRIRDLRLQVVERPRVKRIVLDCQYADYLGRAPQSLPAGNRIEIPEGTRAVCRIAASKPLSKMQVHDPSEQADLATQLAVDDPHEAHFLLEPGAEDRVLLITLFDQHGIENRDPFRLVVSVAADMPPEVSVGLTGIGSAITPQARIPWTGQITDEYGLREVWYESQIGAADPQRWDLPASVGGKSELNRFETLDLTRTHPGEERPLIELAPGDQIALSVHASDDYDLSGQPHVGSSQRYLLDVVTESELRGLLEKRELALRQRFESIYEKMLATRELLKRIEIPESGAQRDEQAEQTHRRDQLRVSGCLQNAAQLSHETVGVAEGFEGIVTELVNNRIDTEELTQRLHTHIATPLREIGEEMLPELQSSLKLLEQAYEGPHPEEALYRDVALRSDLVVQAMKSVLDRMLELESYNELVALLRSIVAEQKQLQQDTKQERREKLRDLLGE